MRKLNRTSHLEIFAANWHFLCYSSEKSRNRQKQKALFLTLEAASSKMANQYRAFLRGFARFRRFSSQSQQEFYQNSNRRYRTMCYAIPTTIIGATVGVSTAFCAETDVYYDSHPIPKRLERFSKFASVEYNGVVYMTPQDLLDSLVLDEPRERVFRNVLEKRDVERMLRLTPALKKGTKDMFRSLGHNGIISYAEYLFLLTLLTKSHSSFKVAFSIFDDDGNEKIDKEEFLKIRSLVMAKNKVGVDALQLEEALMKARIGLDSAALPMAMDVCDIANMDQIQADETDCKRQDTTILLHLFGPKGRNSISFDQFEMFYNNLQRELIEIEFSEFARGKNEIAAVDFAKLVLRYSLVSEAKYEEHLRRVANRVSLRDPGITLDQFQQFSKFLNNLEDFSRAVRLYVTADIPVSRKEFVRAVRCSTGLELSEHLVDVIFKIFDNDNDGNLSYNEFIDIMNDRLHRGFKNQTRGSDPSQWQMFKDCIFREMTVNK
ncbi:unnamed protein product [Bursaphelenchus xylophilus]|uniref:(pine wood nematode) hypothetical protein n=1 Tax=Bursaphelenchus xylophilus TaxID=6326 RepID=A0A811KUL3_BURXY|nr:unnamed protein product [Bursaphelenchus xylophilus]CAG9104820.1 unnamed protein product [Bursaphelenchus xylophilus]